MLSLRNMIGIHQGRERSDVLLALVLPAFLMLVSAYTNAWAFTGGNLTCCTGAAAVNTIDAILRGLFVEGLVFSCFKIVKMLCSSGNWFKCVSALVPGLVGLVAVIVSAGCGLAWVAKSGQMDWMIHAVSAFLPAWIVSIFQSGMGLLFPVALAVLAVYDISSLIEEHIRSGAHLGGLAMRVQSAEHHQTMLLKAQEAADEDEHIKASYDQMAQVNAQQAVEAARQGDYTFGLSTEPLKAAPQSGPAVQRINPPTAMPSLPAPGTVPQQAGYINGQYTTNFGPSTGHTQPINAMPPAAPVAAPAPVQKKSVLGWLSGK